jgi:hypothetical protein
MVASCLRKASSAYLDEMTRRFPNRKNPSLFRDTLIKLIAAEHLEYDDRRAGQLCTWSA